MVVSSYFLSSMEEILVNYRFDPRHIRKTTSKWNWILWSAHLTNKLKIPSFKTRSRHFLYFPILLLLNYQKSAKFRNFWQENPVNQYRLIMFHNRNDMWALSGQLWLFSSVCTTIPTPLWSFCLELNLASW